MRLAVRVSGPLFIAVACACLVPRSAHAHGRLKSSAPSSGAHLAQVPRELRLDFSESPDLTFSSLRLLNQDGREIPLGPPGYPADSHRSIVARIAGPMTAGSYTVLWLMAGDDGHPVRGRVEFVVAPGAAGVGVTPDVRKGASSRERAPNGDGTTRTPAHHDPVSMPEGNGFGADATVYVLIRWVEFAALLLSIGAAAFHMFVLAPMRRTNSSTGHAGGAALIDAADERAARLGRAAILALAMSLVARLAAQSYAMHGDDRTFDPALVVPMIGHTRWGWSWLLQLAGIAIAGVGFQRAGSVGARARASWWIVAATGAILLAFSPGLASHASSAPRARALALLADGLHVLSASSWLGTLALVLVAGIGTAHGRESARGGMFVRHLITAFSPVALVSAAIAASTGTFAAWLHVGTIPNLRDTRYGVTLLIKLAVLGIVALTGLYNWRVVKPQLGTPEATHLLRRSARIEVGVALVVLLITAVLVALPTSLDVAN